MSKLGACSTIKGKNDRKKFHGIKGRFDVSALSAMDVHHHGI
jgi:hypothetical protein